MQIIYVGTKNINFRLEEELTEKLDEYAERYYEGNRSLVIVKAIKQFLEIEEEGEFIEIDNTNAELINERIDLIEEKIEKIASLFEISLDNEKMTPAEINAYRKLKKKELEEIKKDALTPPDEQ